MRMVCGKLCLGKKYLSRYTLTKVTSKPGDSHFWAGLMKVKDTAGEQGKLLVEGMMSIVRRSARAHDLSTDWLGAPSAG
jgi:hypothetical protein